MYIQKQTVSVDKSCLQSGYTQVPRERTPQLAIHYAAFL